MHEDRVLVWLPTLELGWQMSGAGDDTQSTALQLDTGGARSARLSLTAGKIGQVIGVVQGILDLLPPPQDGEVPPPLRLHIVLPALSVTLSQEDGLGSSAGGPLATTHVGVFFPLCDPLHCRLSFETLPSPLLLLLQTLPRSPLPSSHTLVPPLQLARRSP